MKRKLPPTIVAVLLATGVTLLAAGPAYAGFGGTNGKIGFASTRGGNTDIYVIDSDGSNETRLTTNAAAETQPAWSPGANKVAYARGGDIWVMNADGSGQTNLTNSADADTDPDWSRDGSKIVFTSTRGGNSDLYVVNANGSGGEVRLTNAASVDAKAEADAGGPGDAYFFISNRDTGTNRIWYTSGDGIAQGAWATPDPILADDVDVRASDGAFVYSSGGDVFLKIGAGAPTNLTGAGADTQPAFSPEGLVALVSDRDGDTDIYTLSTTSPATQTNRTNNSVPDFDPDWGPVTGTTSGQWLTCSYGLTQACVKEFTVSVGGSSGGLTAPPASVQHYVFGPNSIAVARTSVFSLSLYDLTGSGPLTTSSLAHLVVNIGSFDPVVMKTTANVVSYSSSLNATAGNEITLDLRPRSISWIAPYCPDGECGDASTQASFDGGAIFASVDDLDLSFAPPEFLSETTAWRTAMRGQWISTDAQIFGGPEYDPATNAFSVTAAAPHLMASGAVNAGYLDAFVPNSLITWWGLDPANVAGSSFSVTQTKNGVTTTMTLTFTPATGGVRLSLPEGSFSYSAPQFNFDAVPPSGGGGGGGGGGSGSSGGASGSGGGGGGGSGSAGPTAPTAPTAPVANADVGVSLAGPGAAEVGDRVTYTATVSNAGPVAAPGVTLSGPLPDGLRLVSASPSRGSCSGDGNTVSCSLGELAPGASETVTIVVEPVRAGEFKSDFSVGADATDASRINQTADVRTNVREKAAATPQPTPATAPPVTQPAAQPPATAPAPVLRPTPAATPRGATPKPKPKALPKKKPVPKKKPEPRKK